MYLSTSRSGPECPAGIKEVFRQVDTAITDTHNLPLRTQVMEEYMHTSDTMDNGDFALYFADIFV